MRALLTITLMSCLVLTACSQQRFTSDWQTTPVEVRKQNREAGFQSQKKDWGNIENIDNDRSYNPHANDYDNWRYWGGYYGYYGRYGYSGNYGCQCLGCGC